MLEDDDDDLSQDMADSDSDVESDNRKQQHWRRAREGRQQPLRLLTPRLTPAINFCAQLRARSTSSMKT